MKEKISRSKTVTLYGDGRALKSIKKQACISASMITNLWYLVSSTDLHLALAL